MASDVLTPEQFEAALGNMARSMIGVIRRGARNDLRAHDAALREQVRVLRNLVIRATYCVGEGATNWHREAAAVLAATKPEEKP